MPKESAGVWSAPEALCTAWCVQLSSVPCSNPTRALTPVWVSRLTARDIASQALPMDHGF